MCAWIFKLHNDLIYCTEGHEKEAGGAEKIQFRLQARRDPLMTFHFMSAGIFSPHLPTRILLRRRFLIKGMEKERRLRIWVFVKLKDFDAHIAFPDNLHTQSW